MNPYVFFVGAPRSGTTLVQRLANAHPQLAVTHETRWIARWYEKRVGVAPDGNVTAELIERLPGHSRFKALKITPDELAEIFRQLEPVSYADFVGALFDRFAARRDKHLAGDKTPEYVVHLQTLHELWPDARFAHIIRDGRDVCLSMLGWRKGADRFTTWDEDPVTTIALWWEWHVRLGRERGAALGPHRYHELRYEALTADPAAECARLCDFLDIAYDDQMLRFHEGKTRTDPGLDAKRAWRPVTAGLRTWESQMSRGDLARFEAAAGELLDELGYPRAVPNVPHDEIERVARARTTFANEVRQRHRRVPERWAAHRPDVRRVSTG